MAPCSRPRTAMRRASWPARWRQRRPGRPGIGLSYGGQTQTLNLISAALGSAGLATNMASDFASGNLGQGLLDSLNLYLPAVAQAFANAQSNLSALAMNSAAFAQATAQATIVPDYSTAIQQAFESVIPPTAESSGQTEAPTQYGFAINTAAFAAAEAAGASSVPNFGGAISQLSAAAMPSTGGTSETVSINGTSWDLTFAPASAATNGAATQIDVTAAEAGTVAAVTPDTIQATLAGIANDIVSFLGYLNPIATAEAAGPTPDTSPGQQALFSTAAQAFANAQVPYVLGGTTTAGADCSGSIDAIYAAAGISIGHMLSGDFPLSPLFTPVIGAPEVGDVGWEQGHVVMWGGNLGFNAQGQQLSIWSATHTGGPVFGAFTANYFGSVTYYRYIGH